MKKIKYFKNLVFLLLIAQQTVCMDIEQAVDSEEGIIQESEALTQGPDLPEYSSNRDYINRCEPCRRHPIVFATCAGLIITSFLFGFTWFLSCRDSTPGFGCPSV